MHSVRDTDLRTEMDRRLNTPLDDNERKLIKKRKYLQDYENHREDRDELVDEALDFIRDIRDFIPREGKASPPVDRSPGIASQDPRSVLAILFANDAAEDEGVQRFRSEALDNQLLDYANISAWIRERKAKEEELPIGYLTLRIPRGSGIDADELSRALVDGDMPQLGPGIQVGQEVDMLTFPPEPGGEWVEATSVRNEGALQRLKRLSDRLADSYGWERYHAVAFVLSDAVPPVSGIKVKSTMSPNRPAPSRVTLSVTPSCKPEEVRKAYSTIRKRLLGPRQRLQTKKTLHLVAFCAQRPRRERWSDTFERWNSEYPDWAYSRPDNLRVAYSKACKRLMEQDKPTGGGPNG